MSLIRHHNREVVGLFLLFLVLGGTLFPWAARTAHAKNNTQEPITIVGTNGAGVNLRSGPGLNYPIIGNIPEGSSSQDYLCFTYGDMVGNPGTTLWFKVNYNGVVGYYSSYYDTVPLERQDPSDLLFYYNLFGCDQVVPNYNRNAAVQWALANAPLNSQNPSSIETCTIFVSKALAQGGFPADDQWWVSGAPGPVNALSGSETAMVSDQLIDYLRATYTDRISYTEISFDNSGFVNVPVEPGDIIAYDLGYDPAKDAADPLGGHGFKPDHLAFVVNVNHDPNQGDYPEVSDWGHAYHYHDNDGLPLADYVKRGWTWSEVYQTWLQAQYNGTHQGGLYSSHDGIAIRAFLLHFNF